MTLPLVLSVPHAGLTVPEEVRPYCVLTAQALEEDGDVGAAEIYDLAPHVEIFVTSPIARAIVDLNRAPGDRRPDGVVKTHTCWNVPVYDPFPSEEVVKGLLRDYYYPYHERLSRSAAGGVILGIDCHTMAAQGPPVGPDPGECRPWVCLSNGDGTCPEKWIESLRGCFASLLDGPVLVNQPFRGGYITRSHAAEMPWLQLELSREPFLSRTRKREAVLAAITRWCERWAPLRS